MYTLGINAVYHDCASCIVEARQLGSAARRYAQELFNIGRFVGDWNDAFATVTQ